MSSGSRKIIYPALIFLLTLNLILFGMIFHSGRSAWEVAFLDVGQGDAILISKGSRQILIDGGPSGERILEKLGEKIPFWDRTIEVLIATHPDADHIGGLVSVLENYRVEKILDSGALSDSQIFKKYEKLVEEKEISRSRAVSGMVLRVDERMFFEIFHPDKDLSPGRDSNASSVFGKLVFGRNSFLLTGDLPSEREDFLASSGFDLRSGVLKVSHHGSKHSTSENFLRSVSPRKAIISAGKRNRYGHPAPEVLERLKSAKIETFRTDESGDIVFSCSSPEKECLLRVEK